MFNLLLLVVTGATSDAVVSAVEGRRHSRRESGGSGSSTNTSGSSSDSEDIDDSDYVILGEDVRSRGTYVTASLSDHVTESHDTLSRRT